MKSAINRLKGLMTSTRSYNLKIVVMVKSFIIVGIGGFFGSGARYLISRYIQISFDSVFPWGTFIVNILGSFLIGVFFGISEKGNFMSSEWRLFLTVGICGGFTTFSSLSNDAFLL